MACEICKHCNGAVNRNDVAVLEGNSYHKKCKRCYVCDETDLKNAEVFQGVIFCSSCSQRIFRGCSMARKQKEPSRNRPKSVKRKYKPQDMRSEHRDGIIELSVLGGSSHSGDSELRVDNRKALSEIKRPLQEEKQIYNNTSAYKMMKSSVEMGITTDVTQQLLMHMNCLVASEFRHQFPTIGSSKSTNVAPTIKNKVEESDVRVAQLGVSTEIANMALRNKSEQPVIIKSEPRRHKYISQSLTETRHDSDNSGGEEWMDSAYSSLDRSSSNLMDWTLGSILLFPYRMFKRTILERSSMINSLMSDESNKYSKLSLLGRIKAMLYKDFIDHQRRGVRRLYSVINRRKIPHKMGWPELVENANQSNSKCVHLRRSHSYRYMRSQVMRLAGPTASELALIRKRIKKCIAPDFMKKLIRFNQRYIEVRSQSCGNSMLSQKL